MKLPKPFTICDLRFTLRNKSKVSAAVNARPPIVPRSSQQGIALVITLIMLSVTLVMAIAFLALARRERSAVSTVTDTTTARLAADSALNAAQSQIMANLLNTNSFQTSSNGLYNFGLVVSTNYINANGFNPDTALGSNPTNVNFSYTSDSTPYSAADLVQNIANLQFLPRVPVFIVTNTQTGSNDFRFYLDLNRNGQFEDSGQISETNSAGLATGNTVAIAGDPQWIGVLSRPDTMHSPNNQFVSRFAYFAMPIGNGLDINYIHNAARLPLQTTFSPLGGDFRRNQGVGSWEINLGAFLTDLNTNTYAWDASSYSYNPLTGFAGGNGLVDAASIYSYRLNGNSASFNYSVGVLPSVNNVFGLNAGNIFGADYIDEYSDGPFQLTTALPLDNDLADANNPWPGANSANQFYDLTSDLFDVTKTSGGSTGGFTNRLLNAGNGASTYDRYTFYRLLSQLGTDSDPDAGKMNLNYSNVLVTYDVNGVSTGITLVPEAETNLVPWTAVNFFTAAADRMLRFYTTNWFATNPSNYLATYYGVTNTYRYVNVNNDFVTNDPTGFGLTNFTFGGVAGDGYFTLTNQVPAFGITNIPVYINGQFVYSSAINRVLQMAANLYDASTNNFYPSVFKPLFKQDTFGNVFIVGYQQVTIITGGADPQLDTPFNIANLPSSSINSIIKDLSGANINIYGVPWIIGAKKGFPNFNKFGMQNVVQVSRRLQVKRSSVPTTLNSTTFLTNQWLTFSVSNSINAECWNSYTNTYNNPIQIFAADTITMRITNSLGYPDSFNNYQISTNFLMPSWPGYNITSAAMSFTNPLSGVFSFITNSGFYFGSAPPSVSGFAPVSAGWESNRFDFQFPQFVLLTTNRLQLYMLDNNHVIDYVHFAGPQPVLNITEAIETNNPAAVGYGPNMWSQNTGSSANGAPCGIRSQMDAGFSLMTANNGTPYWPNPPLTIPEAQIDGFAQFMGLTAPYSAVLNDPSAQGVLQYDSTNYVVQDPYTPTATISQYTSWQANDPLVHYLSSDLNFSGTETVSKTATGVQVTYGRTADVVYYPDFNVVNDRYQPWGVAAMTSYQNNNYNFSNPYNLAYKDPLIWNSDSWDFPTNIYPTVGWLGRVHRGSPWQTVYLKADNILRLPGTGNNIDAGTNAWSVWTGDVNNLFDSGNSAPVQDRVLFDLFTTHLNDNAGRGTLSVNVGAGNSDPSAGLAAWSALFSGMVALTNTTLIPPIAVGNGYVAPPPTNTSLIIQPAGVGGIYSALGNLVTNINNSRTNFIGADGVKGSFEHVGDILSTSALTEQSPYLNISNTNQLKYGISDEAYEWLPQQMMGLVRLDNAPRYVIYGYGQALRPAPNALVTTGGSNFGLVTNYQVVAESAVRAIISVQQHVTNLATGPVTNYTTSLENYSVLPPN